MSVTLTLTDVDPGGTQVYAFGTVALSGNYPTGGDTVDWTQLVKQIAARGQIIDSSMSGYTTGSAGAEFTGNAAYPSSATGDIITFSAQFRKLT
jgi:hypothetical protein